MAAVGVDQRVKKGTSGRAALQNCFGNWLGHYLSLIHKKTKVDQNLLENSLLRECRRLYPGSDFVLVRDCCSVTGMTNYRIDRIGTQTRIGTDFDHIDTAKQGQRYESIVSRYEY